MTVTLLEVVAAAQKHAAALPGELAGYLLLATADQVASAPRCPDARDIALDEDGNVRVIGGDAATDTQAERRLRELFTFTLSTSAPVTAALGRVAQRAAGSSVRGFAQELEAALIPLNRGASRRALSRLCRETMRAAAQGALGDLASLAARTTAPTPEPEPEPAPVVPVITQEPPRAATPVPSAVLAPEPCDVSDGAAVEVLLAVASPAPPDSSAVPTPRVQARSSAPVRPIDDLHEESTRPETVIARASQRPAAPDAALTPLLGSLAVPECIPAEVARELPEVSVVAGDVTERMPEVEEETAEAELLAPAAAEALVEPAPSEAAPDVELQPFAAPDVEPDVASAELWPCDGFIAWESCAPPPVADTASLADADVDALAVDAAWDDVAFEVDHAFDVIQTDEPAHHVELDAVEPSVLALDPLTLTRPGGIVAECPLPPTPAKPPTPATPAWAPARFLPRKSDVDALLRGFCVGETRDERELCRELSEIAGVGASRSA
jgi:hypothetical protein